MTCVDKTARQCPHELWLGEDTAAAAAVAAVGDIAATVADALWLDHASLALLRPFGQLPWCLRPGGLF